MRGLLCVCVGALLATFVSSQGPVCKPEDDFLPHPTDCNLYYACSGGVAILNNCPEGLWWNTLTEGCDWPVNVNCAAQSTTGNTDITTDSSTGSTTENSTITTTDTPTGSTSNATVTSTGTTVTSTGTTVTSTGTTVTSTGTTVTSTGTTVTSTRTTVTSTGTTGTGTVPTEPTDSSSASTTATTTVDVATEPPGGLPDSCPTQDNPNEIIRLPHESVCDYYYKCTNGTPVTFQCSGGQQFSPTERICRAPEAAGCDRCPTILDTPNQVTRLPHETDCHLYYLCNTNATSVLFQCRLDWHFSRNIRECLTQEEAKCDA